MTATRPVLEVHGLTVRLPGGADRAHAVESVSFSVAPGEIVCVVGESGSGKSVTAHSIMGLLPGQLTPVAGRILLEGQDITELESHKRVRLGLARTFQINQLFLDLTPLETIGLAISERMGTGTQWWRLVGSNAVVTEEIVETLGRFHLTDVMFERTGNLPYGKQRLLEIALAIACRPHVLLLDEPAAGVPDAERHEILATVAALPADVTVLLIEHDMDLVFAFADRISVLVYGELIASGTPAEIRANAAVQEAYLGTLAKTHA